MIRSFFTRIETTLSTICLVTPLVVGSAMFVASSL
jgi:hypothetical protein